MQKVSPVQRQLDDPPLLDDRPHSGVVGIEQRRLSSDLEGLTHLPDYQSEIHACGLLHLELECDPRRPTEPLFLDTHVINARLKRGHAVKPLRVGDDLARRVCAHVSDRHGGPRYDGAAGVRDFSRDCSQSLRGRRTGPQTKKNQKQRSSHFRPPIQRADLPEAPARKC